MGVRILGVAAVFLGTSLIAVSVLHGYRVLLRAALGGGFTRVIDFPLRDSLPALEGGLSNLEAFKPTLSPSGKADPDRSLWIADSIGRIRLEYVGEKRPFDSVLILTWLTDAPLRARTFFTRDALWEDARGRPVSGWSEVVAAYVSFPPVISFRPADSSVTMFKPAEGKVFHVVKGWYGRRKERVLLPDTAYPAPVRGSEAQLMVRGGALALVNPTPRPVRLRVVGSGEHASVIVGVDSASVGVYRALMKNRVPPVLAYTAPGERFPVFGGEPPEPSRFFVWSGSGGSR